MTARVVKFPAPVSAFKTRPEMEIEGHRVAVWTRLDEDRIYWVAACYANGTASQWAFRPQFPGDESPVCEHCWTQDEDVVS